MTTRADSPPGPRPVRRKYADERHRDLDGREDLELYRKMKATADALYRVLRDAPEGTIFWTMTLRHAAADLERVHRPAPANRGYHQAGDDPEAEGSDENDLDEAEADREDAPRVQGRTRWPGAATGGTVGRARARDPWIGG